MSCFSKYVDIHCIEMFKKIMHVCTCLYTVKSETSLSKHCLCYIPYSMMHAAMEYNCISTESVFNLL